MFTALNKNEILKHLKHEDLLLLIKQSVNSTNTYLKKLEPNKTVTICLAEKQTDGRGRLNRVWQSPYGENIYCSFKFEFNGPLTKLAGLSIAICTSLHIFLSKIIDASLLKIKWPNDILYNGKKLAGILIEIERISSESAAVIIGIGLNVNMKYDLENKIKQVWTSMINILNIDTNRNKLISELINVIYDTWSIYIKEGLTYQISYFNNNDFLDNKAIKINHENKIIDGIAAGINEDGHLRLILPNNEIITLCSGEAQILKPIKL